MDIITPRFIPDTIFSSLTLNPDKVAVRDLKGALTYRSLSDRVKRLSSFLSEELHLGRGDAIAILLDNSISFVETHFAILNSGCISVPLDPETKSRNLAHIIKVGRIRAIVAKEADLPNENRRHSGQISSLRITCLNEDGDASGPQVLFEDAILEGNADFKGLRGIDADPAVYMFTTGSTGQPKGIVLTHAQVLSAIRNIIEFVGYRSSDHDLVTLPLSHSFGLGHIYCNLAVGGSVTLLPGIGDFKVLFSNLFQFEPSGMPGTPSMFRILCRLFPSKLRECGKFLKRIIIDSEPTPPELTENLLSLLPDTHIMVYYGLTEASRSTFIDFRKCQDPNYFRSVGQPSPNVEIQIIDDKGNRVESGTTGRVMIRGTHIMKCYLGQPPETQEVLKEGWFITDDLGYLDKKGYLFLTGRISTFINKGGFKIDPREIESVLMGFDGVIDAAALGIPDDIGGEEVVACVVVDGEKFNGKRMEEFRDHCCTNLEVSKIPAKIIKLASIPRSKTGKLLKQDLTDAVLTATSKLTSASLSKQVFLLGHP